MRDSRDGRDGRHGRDGRDVDPEFVRCEIVRILAEMPAPRDGRDGRDVDAETLAAAVQQAVDAIPRPKDGADGRNGVDVDRAFVTRFLQAAVAQIRAPQEIKK